MKYLKVFKDISESNNKNLVFDHEHRAYEGPDPEVIETCKDILLDLKDDDYEFSCVQMIIKYIKKVDIHISIQKTQDYSLNASSRRFFNIHDINDIITRLDDYLLSQGYKRTRISGYSTHNKSMYQQCTLIYRKN